MSRHWSILSNWMVNAVMLAFAAPLIFGVWYPYPTLHVLEMGRTLCTILGIQFFLAVTLPILLIKTNKTKKALAIDWTLIIAIQIAAFLLGFFVLINGRPVAIVFERDRFVVLQANEVVWRSSKGNDHCAIQGSLRGPLLVAVDLQNPKLSPTELIFNPCKASSRASAKNYGQIMPLPPNRRWTPPNRQPTCAQKILRNFS